MTKWCHQGHRLLLSSSFRHYQNVPFVLGVTQELLYFQPLYCHFHRREAAFVSRRNETKTGAASGTSALVLLVSHTKCPSSYKVASVVKWNDCPVSKLSYEMFHVVGTYFCQLNNSMKYILSKLPFVVRGKQNLNSEVLVSLLDSL